MKTFVCNRRLFVASALAALAWPHQSAATRNWPELTLRLSSGVVRGTLRPDCAPITVARYRELANAHFYDGLTIVRVAPGHVIQGGDPKFDGSGGTGVELPLELSDLRHTRGAIGVARNEDPNSGDCQFYICLRARPHLDGRFTVFGHVHTGMPVLDALRPGDGEMGFISRRDDQPKIFSLRIAD